MKKTVRILPVLLAISIAGSCAPASPSTTGNQSAPEATTAQVTKTTQTSAVKPEQEEEANITFEKIVMTDTDEASLHEITDPAIIDQITKTISDSQSYVTKSTNQNGDVFQAIIPIDLAPNSSHEISDVLNGISKDPALVKKYAALFKSDFSKIKNPVKYFSEVSNVYSLAWLLAETFILEESTTNLDEIGEEIEKISEFQNREFKSKIMSATSEVKDLIKFTSEIVDNEEARTRKQHNLENLRSNVIQLLNQVNLAITESVVNEKIDFVKYVNHINDEAILIEHQRILTNLLEEISNLMFVFSKGNISSDQSLSIYNEYIDKSNKARTTLSQWHNEQIEAFGIDLENKKFTKQGIEGIFSVIPGVFNKDWTKKELDDTFIQRITDQTKNPAFVAGQPRVLTGINVTIIIKNGKYYFQQAKKV